MFTLIGAALTAVTGIFSSWMKRKQIEAEGKIAIAKAKAQIMTKQAGAEIDWNRYWSEQASMSWKDEWFTIMLSVPVIMAFIPPLAPYVAAGFAQLEGTPGWYKAAFGVAVAAAFGFRKIASIIGGRGFEGKPTK